MWTHKTKRRRAILTSAKQFEFQKTLRNRRYWLNTSNSYVMENENHQELIQKLLNCALTCEHCATSCLQEEDVAMMANCISLDRDCSDICFQAARLLQRESQIGRQFLVLCEKICRMCAEECSQHDDEHCQRCAEACRACADACHQHHQPMEQA